VKNTNTNAKYDTCLNIVKNMDWKNLEIILPTQTLKIDYKKLKKIFRNNGLKETEVILTIGDNDES